MTRWLDRMLAMPPVRAMSWHGSNRMFLGIFAAVLGAAYLFVLLVDPYGVVPFSLPFQRPLVTDQRQMYPQILRSGRYDSIVVGTSTSGPLDPAVLDRVLGGHFATFAMVGGTAVEEVETIDFFGRSVSAPKAVVIGLDHEWCYRNDSPVMRERSAAREDAFPFWAYDDDPWNDYFHLLNRPTVDAAVRTVLGLAGRLPEKMRPDGYGAASRSMDLTYDVAARRDHIWGGPSGEWLRAAVPARPEPDSGVGDFSALPWLDESLGRLPAEVSKYLLLLPVHIRALRLLDEDREAECKRRITAIALRNRATLVDWRIASPLSAADDNFWDVIHYRVPVGDRIIDDLGHIVHEGRESPDGSYRILVR